MSVLALIVAALLAMVGITVVPPSAGVAAVSSFAADLLHGDNGLPTSPDFPALRYGPISTPVDVGGNAVDAHEGQDIEYFGGSYYLYGVAFGCGTHIDLSDNTPFCGFSAYRSEDLTNWRPVGDFRSPQLRAICTAYCAYPKVVFSPGLDRYLLYFSSDNGGRWLAESASPAGPWRNFRTPKLGGGGSDAYSLPIGRDGRAYMVDFQRRNLTETDIWVDRLNADRTATAGTATQVTSGAYDAVSAFAHGPYWYLTLSRNARYFGPAELVYLRASSPLGPWSAPVTISDDSCGGTAQSVSVLPSAKGPVPVELIDLYRSSPGDANPALPDRAKHGDWNQALAGRYWAPLSFDAHGGIKPITCDSATRIPLADATRSAAPPVYQPDCRITGGSSIEQQWRAPARLSQIRLPVFQRAYVTDPSLPARTQPPTAVDAPLTVDLVTPSGTAHWTVGPGDVSWAPRSISLTLPRPVPRGSQVSLHFRTTASDGCYGVLIGPGTAGRYSAIAGGTSHVAPGAHLVLDNP